MDSLSGWGKWKGESKRGELAIPTPLCLRWSPAGGWVMLPGFPFESNVEGHFIQHFFFFFYSEIGYPLLSTT